MLRAGIVFGILIVSAIFIYIFKRMTVVDGDREDVG
jgi:hypothetical protein